MSWSASGTATVRWGTAEINLGSPQTQTGHGEEESKKALAQTEAAAKGMLESGAYGEGKFSVSLSGHSNPGNKATVGWSNDFASITINQVGE